MSDFEIYYNFKSFMGNIYAGCFKISTTCIYRLFLLKLSEIQHLLIKDIHYVLNLQVPQLVLHCNHGNIYVMFLVIIVIIV